VLSETRQIGEHQEVGGTVKAQQPEASISSATLCSAAKILTWTYAAPRLPGALRLTPGCQLLDLGVRERAIVDLDGVQTSCGGLTIIDAVGESIRMCRICLRTETREMGVRVFASGSSINQPTIRKRLSAEAIATFCKCVLA